MNNKWMIRFVVTVLATLLLAEKLVSQTQEHSNERWAPDRTAWGTPDFQGDWSFGTITPLERPGDYAGREYLTNKEVVDVNRNALTLGDQLPPPGDPGGYNAFWFDRGKSTGRTSLIIDPSNGRIPYTAEGRKRSNTRRELRNRPAHGPEDRSPGERCIHHAKAGPPHSSGGYNNHLKFLQTPSYVVIWTEQIHDARIIPMDGRPPISANIRQWMGNSRGHWEGDTLIIETTNFSGKAAYQGSSEKLHLTERFTLVNSRTLGYEYTVEDPSSYSRSWTASIAMEPVDGDLYEFACHEGNYGLLGILSGARADEQSTGTER